MTLVNRGQSVSSRAIFSEYAEILRLRENTALHRWGAVPWSGGYALKQKQVLRKKFVAVVGYADSGKSTVIQSLSGCNNHSTNEKIRDASVGLCIYVLAPSPQELPVIGEEDFTSILQDVTRDETCQGVVAAIQPTLPTKRLSMEKMFDLARKFRFESFAYVLEFPFCKGKKLEDRIGNLENIKTRILGIDSEAKVFPMDGRRFACLNADLIREPLKNSLIFMVCE
jgi:predicted kinase